MRQPRCAECFLEARKSLRGSSFYYRNLSLRQLAIAQAHAGYHKDAFSTARRIMMDLIKTDALRELNGLATLVELRLPVRQAKLKVSIPRMRKPPK